MEQPSIQIFSNIKCPYCGYQKKEEMPVGACQFFWECPNCSKVLKPEAGDCCVFCSYGSQVCPSVQEENHAAEN